MLEVAEEGGTDPELGAAGVVEGGRTDPGLEVVEDVDELVEVVAAGGATDTKFCWSSVVGWVG